MLFIDLDVMLFFKGLGDLVFGNGAEKVPGITELFMDDYFKLIECEIESIEVLKRTRLIGRFFTLAGGMLPR